MPHPAETKDDKGNRLLFVGRIAEQRNVKFLLRGFAKAVDSTTSLTLSIVGEPIQSRYNRHEWQYAQQVWRLAATLRLQGAMAFRGGLYGRPLWEAYQKNDIFVCTSR